ncbi:MAG TPA: hypothetical protein VHW24_12630 [Bryobacteraceae bacterium]|nr:hypothetical protein [Bryobacteraceae bacterium]
MKILTRSALAFICGLATLGAASLPRPYIVESYAVSLVAKPNASLTGDAFLTFRGRAESAVSALELDSAGLTIKAVLAGKERQYFERKGKSLVIALTRPLQPDARLTLEIQYEAPPSDGLIISSNQIAGVQVSDWLPCNDRPGERARFHLTLTAPETWKTAASGSLVNSHAVPGGMATEWNLDTAAPAAEFGFTAGAFSESVTDASGVKLRTLAGPAEAAELAGAALRYLGERTGKAYPGTTYTQAFIHAGATYAKAGGLALLPDSFSKNLSDDIGALQAVSFAIAQQWFGVGIATKDEGANWLTFGLPAFLADTFLEQRLGKAVFEREISRSRDLYTQLRARGNDKPLADASESADGIALETHKAVCFLYVARQMVGDAAFWDGVRTFTSSKWGQTASSEDFQRAFAGVRGNRNRAGAGRSDKSNPMKATAKNLNDLFDLWIYGVPLGNPK